MSEPVTTCLSIDCPERKSLCCQATSDAVYSGEGTGYFVCSKCKKEYIGGKCNAVQRMEAREIKEGIDGLIRDLTKVGFMPKSEARRRIELLLDQKKREVLEGLELEKGEMCDCTICQTIDQQLEEKND